MFTKKGQFNRNIGQNSQIWAVGKHEYIYIYNL